MSRHVYACPFCGLRLVLDDEEKKASHQVPECAKFVALIRQSRGRVHTFVETLDSEGKPVGRGRA